jgi:hypothetical protein
VVGTKEAVLKNQRQTLARVLLSAALVFLALGGWGSVWMRLVFMPQGSEYCDWAAFQNWLVVCFLTGLAGVVGLVVLAVLGQEGSLRVALTPRDIPEGLALWLFTYIVLVCALTGRLGAEHPLLECRRGLMGATILSLPVPVCWAWRRPVAVDGASWLANGLKKFGILLTNISLFLVSTLVVSGVLYLNFRGMGQDELIFVFAVPALMIVAVFALVLGILAGVVSSGFGTRSGIRASCSRTPPRNRKE